MKVWLGVEAAGCPELDLLMVHPRCPANTWAILPIGALALAQYVAARGFRVGLWDANLDPRATDAALAALLSQTAIRWAGLSLFSTQAAEAHRLARLIRQHAPRTRIVAGGEHVSVLPHSIPEADVVVTGPGELALLDLLPNAQPPAGVIHGAPVPDLNDVPLIDRAIWRAYAGYGVLTRLGLMSTRGCPFDCTFCHNPGRGRSIRRYSPARVGELVATAWEETGIDDVLFLDDIFTLDRTWCLAVCRELRRRRLNHLRLACFSHVRTGDPELYAAMAAAGFWQIELGIESAAPAIRARMHKRFSDEQIETTVAQIKAAGIEPQLLFILGYVGETAATLRASLAMAERLETPAWYSLAQPFPGTRFADEARTSGTLLEPDVTRFANHRLVYLPAGVSAAELEETSREAADLRAHLLRRFSRQQPALRRIFPPGSRNTA